MKTFNQLISEKDNIIHEGRLANILASTALAGGIGYYAGTHMGHNKHDIRKNIIAMNKSAVATNISESGKTFIKNYEALRLKPYNDQTGKPITKWVKGATIGYGHLIHPDEWETYKNGITRQQADALFNTDIQEYVDAAKLYGGKLKQHEFDALVSLIYNIGVNQFKNSSVKKLLNKEKGSSYPTLETAWKAFNKSQGKVMAGLTRRREAEYNAYTGGLAQESVASTLYTQSSKERIRRKKKGLYKNNTPTTHNPILNLPAPIRYKRPGTSDAPSASTYPVKG